MILSLISAMSENRVIGKDNQLPWHLPADLQHFKRMTQGKTVIMGRRTFESLGKPLPKRRNIVVTGDTSKSWEGVEVATSLDEAIVSASSEPEVMIIGGSTIYEQALPMADRIYLTVIHQRFEGDTFFPQFDVANWAVASSSTREPDDSNQYRYTFFTYEKRS